MLKDSELQNIKQWVKEDGSLVSTRITRDLIARIESAEAALRATVDAISQQHDLVLSTAAENAVEYARAHFDAVKG